MKTLQTCEKTIHLTNAYGKAGKRKCGKMAVDNIGIPICQRCLNKITAKSGIKELREKHKMTNAELRDNGFISNNKRPITQAPFSNSTK